MNSLRSITLSRLIAVVGFVVASAAAQAGGNDKVYWSVDVDAPMHGSSGRVQTSFSNSRPGGYGYGYREPAQVVYAPQPIVIQAPGRVYYRDEPRYGHRPHFHRHHHHGHHHGRVARRVARNVHNGLARLHQDMANLHAARAEAWSGGRRGGDHYYDRRDDRRGGYGYGRDR